MSNTQELVINFTPSEVDLAAALVEPKLVDGDYRFVVINPPTFKMGTGKNEQTFYAYLRLHPLADARDKASVKKNISIMQRLALPVSQLPPAVVAQRDITETMRFLFALTEDTVFNPGRFANKALGQTKEQHEIALKAATKAVGIFFQGLKNKPDACLTWAVDGRLRTNGQYQNASWYTESYVKSGLIKEPVWAYSVPKLA